MSMLFKRDVKADYGRRGSPFVDHISEHVNAIGMQSGRRAD